MSTTNAFNVEEKKNPATWLKHQVQTLIEDWDLMETRSIG